MRGRAPALQLPWSAPSSAKPQSNPIQSNPALTQTQTPKQNQMNHCWAKYNEWVLCLKETEGDAEQCFDRRRAALAICPNHWTEKWDEVRRGCSPT
mmetsp:Transcript_40769/g.127579  ORF Transcript_40769/g.127579 Transcript_40769/m.127579 type:complete len:96 (+) Transcript_40769:261-548(+)